MVLTTLRRVTPQPVKDAYRRLVPRTMARAFGEVYRDEVWGGGSGRGSTPENTVAYRGLVEGFLREHHIRSVVDIGCGDWAFAHLTDWGSVDYLGLDTVPSVIAANARRYGPRFRFGALDVSRESLPSADLVIIKDVFQHWPNDEIRRFIPRLSIYRFALITNDAFPGRDLNTDIAMTGYRPIDLRMSPFHLGAKELLRYGTDEVPQGRWNKLVLLHQPQV
jgi:SAM-dependent methyltransferase